MVYENICNIYQKHAKVQTGFDTGGFCSTVSDGPRPPKLFNRNFLYRDLLELLYISSTTQVQHGPFLKLFFYDIYDIYNI